MVFKFKAPKCKTQEMFRFWILLGSSPHSKKCIKKYCVWLFYISAHSVNFLRFSREIDCFMTFAAHTIRIQSLDTKNNFSHILDSSLWAKNLNFWPKFVFFKNEQFHFSNPSETFLVSWTFVLWLKSNLTSQLDLGSNLSI